MVLEENKRTAVTTAEVWMLGWLEGWQRQSTNYE